MVKFYRNILAAAFISVIGLNAGAVDYINVNPVVSPADGYVGGPQGVISITWPGVRLKMDSEDRDMKNPIDPSFVNITVNGQEEVINPDVLGGGKILLGSQYIMNGTSETRVDDQLLISLPDRFFFWTGSVQIEVKEGTVTSTDGAVNAPITLNYTFTELNYDGIWDPKRPLDGSTVSFVQGDVVFYLSWEGYDNPQINENSFPFYQQETATDTGIQVSALPYMSVEDGKIKFDFSSMEPGIYLLDVPDACVTLADGVLNGETTYNFIITEAVIPPTHVTVLPSEYDWFDAFGVVWADDVTKPFEISSEYAEYNEDADNSIIFNEEGLALIKVTENGLDEVEVLQVAIVEYQEDEYTQNYPYAQLVVTLADIQANIGSRYTLTIPAGVVKIKTGDNKWANNTAVTYTFTLTASDKFALPEPTVNPEPGEVETLNKVNIWWEGAFGYDLLNKNEGEITVECDGEPFADFNVYYGWSSEEAMTDGADGDILEIVFPEELPDATYVITIPAGFVRVSDIDNGTLDNEELTLIYILGSAEGAVERIDGENGEVVIYNLNGLRVNNTDKLPSGIYIINGKKMVVK